MSTGSWAVAVTLGIFVLSHIGITIWWASKVNTLLDIVQAELKDIVVELKATRGLFVTKEELSYRVSSSDKEHAAMWRRIDEVAGKI